MLKYMTGSIFDSKADALVNPVNCVGVMGKGLALEFKKRYPDNFRAYKEWCDSGEARPGENFLHFSLGERIAIIFNFPTKLHWKDPGKIEYIVDGLDDLKEMLAAFNVGSIALPMLGCGLGVLKANDVLPLIERFAESVPEIEVELWRN